MSEYFELDEGQLKRIDEWFAALQKRIIAEGKAPKDPLGVPDDEYVYYGAIGGGLTYSFTPTSIGLIVKVQEAITGEKLDLSDYDSW